MSKIRVLVVDDSVVIRRLLSDVLSQDPDIELAGTAPNGRIALAKLPQLNPDLVTLDIEMPELDGLATLTELRKVYPKLPVIMFSTLTERGAAATLDALARGATDYVTKPANVGSVAAGMQSVRDQLIPRIKAFCAPPRPVGVKPAASALVARKPINRLPQRCDLVAIGSSTGGPQALAAVLSKLPATFPVPIVVVQHMPPVFTKHLANRLSQVSGLDVREARGGEILQRGQVLIAPGDFHVELFRQGTEVKTRLTQAPHQNSCRPSVDVMFRSAAQIYGPGCLGVVLTGMGHDGLRGAELITAAGGNMLAQDEATSVVWGMPRAIHEAGLARHTLALPLIPHELLRQVSIARASSINPLGIS